MPLEARLNQSQRLESLGQLAGGVAHDFNNLLGVILNYATFVAEETAGNEQVHHDVAAIQAAAQRAAALTRQLLLFSRREKVAPQNLDVSAVVADIHTLLSRSIGEHVELVIDAGSDLPSVRIDRGQLEQVLVNLAVNGRDAMADGGRLTIETTALDLDETCVGAHPDLVPGRYVQVTVSDTGAGMSDDVIARAFEPFFTTKERGRGSGLGLATVYGIVTEARGTIRIDSKLGLGTRFRVYLPACHAPVVDDTGEAHTAGWTPGGERILLVEDEASLRTVTARLLERAGFEVVQASNGIEAIHLVQDRSFDLLLTDVVMPQMAGPDLADQLRAHQPDLAVLYMSGYSDGELGPGRGLDEGILLLQKPFAEHQLLESIGAALASRERHPR